MRTCCRLANCRVRNRRRCLATRTFWSFELRLHSRLNSFFIRRRVPSFKWNFQNMIFGFSAFDSSFGASLVQFYWSVDFISNLIDVKVIKGSRVTVKINDFGYFGLEFQIEKLTIGFSTFYSTLSVNFIEFEWFTDFISNFQWKSANHFNEGGRTFRVTVQQRFNLQI